jgi:hypothetical protein
MKGHPAALERLSSKEDFSPSAFGPLLTPIQANSARLGTNQNERDFFANLLNQLDLH